MRSWTLFQSLLLALALTTVAPQAGSLEGTIRDSSGAVLPGVSLTLLDRASSLARTAVSDDSGRYRFESARPGDYLLQAKLEGFSNLARGVRVGPEGSSLDLTMQVSVISDQLVVTASGSAQLASETARTPYVVDSAELENRNESFLGEALLPLPGLSVQRLQGPGSFTTVRFRGLRNADTGLLLNGFRVRDAGGFRGDFTAFFEEMMLTNAERIEALPGASSSLYGNSASGGVINIIPRMGSGRPSVEAAFEGGSLEFFQERFSSDGSLGDRFHYSFGAIRSDVNAGVDGDDVFRNTSLNSMLQFDLHPDIKVSGIFHYSDTPRIDLNSSPFPIGPEGNELGYAVGEGPVAGFVEDLDDPDNRRESSLFTGIFNWEHRLNSFWSYSAYFQDTETRRDFRDGPLSHPILDGLGVSEFAFDSSLIDGSSRIVGVKNTFQLGLHHLVTLGIEHERESRSSRFTVSGPPGAKTTDRQSSTAFFVQDQISLMDRRLQLTANFRSEFFDVDNPESVPELQGLDTPDAYTGGLGIAYFLSRSGTKIRAQAANGFRAPSLSERFSVFNSEVGPIRIGNPLLRPERSFTMDAGIDQLLFNDRVRISATYFYNRLQEIIASTSLFQQSNQRGGLSRGFEWMSQAALLPGLDLRASYTFTKADFVPVFDVLRSDNTIAPAGLSRPFEGTPEHRWALGLNWQRGRWNVNADYAGTSGYEEPLFSPSFPFTQVLFDFDGFNRLDLTLTYRIPTGDQTRVELYLKAENVFDEEYFQDGFRTPGAVAWGGLRFKFR